MRRLVVLTSAVTTGLVLLLAVLLSGAVSSTAGSPAAGASQPGSSAAGTTWRPSARAAAPTSDHLDDAPPGVDVRRQVSTEELIERSGVRRRPSVFKDVRRAPARSGARTAAGEAVGPELLKVLSVPAGAAVLGGLGTHVSPSCSGSTGNRVQVLYVREASKASRHAGMLTALRSMVADVDDTFALSSPTSGRRVRWVQDASCQPVVPEVVVADGVLTGDNDGLSALAKSLAAAGHNRGDRKYLAFSDASVLCGIGQYVVDSRASAANWSNGGQAMYARVDTACWPTYRSYHSTAAHELMHMLGAVQPTAPHSTRNGHCTDEADAMCYDDNSGQPMVSTCTAAGSEALFDCRHDDYYDDRAVSTGYLASNWNTARSSFLDTVPALGAATTPVPTVTVTPTPPPTAKPTPTATRRAVSVGLRVPATLYVGAAGRAVVTVGSTAGPVSTGVTLQRYDASLGWRPVASARTSSTGVSSFLLTGSRASTLTLRAVVPATTTVSTAVSSTQTTRLVRRPTASAGTVRLGRPDTLAATVRTNAGTPVAGKYVELQRRYAGTTTWRAVTGKVTSSTGRVTITVQPKRLTYYRWAFAGTTTLAPSRTGSLTVAY